MSASHLKLAASEQEPQCQFNSDLIPNVNSFLFWKLQGMTGKFCHVLPHSEGEIMPCEPRESLVTLLELYLSHSPGCQVPNSPGELLLIISSPGATAGNNRETRSYLPWLTDTTAEHAEQHQGLWDCRERHGKGSWRCQLDKQTILVHEEPPAVNGRCCEGELHESSPRAANTDLGRGRAQGQATVLHTELGRA